MAAKVLPVPMVACLPVPRTAFLAAYLSVFSLEIGFHDGATIFVFWPYGRRVLQSG
ncbi:MAG: hypothetical protein ACR2Q4_03945 [Geminicoccaceae bacterium]